MSQAINRVPRRSTVIRAQWQSHITAQQSSGLTQAAYCREHGLNAKYLSLWKRKLRPTADSPALIPVIVKPAKVRLAVRPSCVAVSKSAQVATDLLLKTSLPNGVAVEVHFSNAAALMPLLLQLAQLQC